MPDVSITANAYVLHTIVCIGIFSNPIGIVAVVEFIPPYEDEPHTRTILLVSNAANALSFVTEFN